MLEENSWVTLSSIVIVAYLRTLSIIHYTIIVLVRQLTGNSYALAKYSWLVWSIDCTINIIFEKIIILSQDLIKLINELFMITIFNLFKEELPLLQEFIDYFYNDKSIKQKIIYFNVHSAQYLLQTDSFILTLLNFFKVASSHQNYYLISFVMCRC